VRIAPAIHAARTPPMRPATAPAVSAASTATASRAMSIGSE
jgi:hypothetical protein